MQLKLQESGHPYHQYSPRSSAGYFKDSTASSFNVSPSTRTTKSTPCLKKPKRQSIILRHVCETGGVRSRQAFKRKLASMGNLAATYLGLRHITFLFADLRPALTGCMTRWMCVQAYLEPRSYMNVSRLWITLYDECVESVHCQ